MKVLLPALLFLFGFVVFPDPSVLASYPTLTILHNFSGNASTDGGYPQSGLLQHTDGNLYGADDASKVFRLTPSGMLTVLHTFGDGSVPNDGNGTDGSLIEGPDGAMYSTTYVGGSANQGTIYQITTAGVVTIMHSFGDGTVVNDGIEPFAGLRLGHDGNFYGTTKHGGPIDGGVIFKMTPSGTVTTLHQFGDGVSNDGNNDEGEVVQAADGSLYGATPQGGLNNNGVIFRISPTGVYSIVHRFGDGTVANDGTGSQGDLLIASDGNIYGTCCFGGINNNGTIWRMTPATSATPYVVTIMHFFSDGTVTNDGISPIQGLIQASDGNLYGGTYGGGVNGNGVVFRMSLAGNYTLLHVFGDGSVANDGSHMFVYVTEGADGNIYGLTFQGGTANAGTACKIATNRYAHSWTAMSLSVGADDITRMLWGSTSGQSVIWGLDEHANRVSSTTPQGPFAGWSATGIAVGPNNLTRMLWTDPQEAEISFWDIDDKGTIRDRHGYGPFSGWTASSPSVGPDNLTRLLWNYAPSGAAEEWTLDGTGLKDGVSKLYGPFSGWRAIASAVGPDSLTRVLWWNSQSGQAVLWIADDKGDKLYTQTYGPLAGWSPAALSVGSDNLTRLLWDNANGMCVVWQVDAHGNKIGSTPGIGPFSGWKATKITTGSDKLTRLLWNDFQPGQASVFIIDDAGHLLNHQAYGPY